MSQELRLILLSSIVLPVCISIARFRTIDKNFLPFIYFLWLSFIIDFIDSVISIPSAIITMNIYYLFESLFVLWQFTHIYNLQHQQGYLSAKLDKYYYNKTSSFHHLLCISILCRFKQTQVNQLISMPQVIESILALSIYSPSLVALRKAQENPCDLSNIRLFTFTSVMSVFMMDLFSLNKFAFLGYTCFDMHIKLCICHIIYGRGFIRSSRKFSYA